MHNNGNNCKYSKTAVTCCLVGNGVTATAG